jgi:hypothetical protein
VKKVYKTLYKILSSLYFLNSSGSVNFSNIKKRAFSRKLTVFFHQKYCIELFNLGISS